MKIAITLFIAVVSTVLASLSLAAPPSALDQENRAAAIGRLMDAWQARILASNLPVEDPKNWSLRNMAKFSRLNAERLALAQRASTLEELNLVLLDAPIGAGSQLDVLMANPAGDISMIGARNVAKSSPATSPGAYAGLVFTATTTCRILDTRPSQGGFGAWAAGSSNLVKIGPYSTAGGGYATGPGAQGGSATSCGLDALAGPGQIAVIMAAVSTVSQVGAGYITFYPQGAPNPGTTSVSQWYQPGYVQTSFVLIPSDLVGTVAASGFTAATTDVIIDVVGYFAAEPPEGTVTSITAGTGLTGGTITTTGTIGLAATNLFPTVACTTNQIPKWSGTAWACAADANSGGTVTGVTASAPIASSGGAAPNISLTGTIPVANGGTGQTSLATNGVVFGQGTAAVATAVGVTGQVLTGINGGPPTWTGSPSLSGNLTLVDPSTASAGNIMKGGNTFIHNFGNNNTFVGENAGNFTMSGGNNTAIGVGALDFTTSGGSNTASGAAALFSNTTGSENTVSGASALVHNTTGSDNTASGYEALFSNTTGSFNTASGLNALASNTTGNDNAATGSNALQNNTSGAINTADGQSALFSNTTGNENTASGASALLSNTTGSNNIALGAGAGSNLTTGNNNIDIVNVGVAAEGATIRIGDFNQTKTFIAGIRGVTTGVANGVAVLVDSNGQLGTVSSSRRFKDDIADMDAASSALMKLRPVTFHYKTDQDTSGRTLQYGLIAEEVADVYPGLVAHSNDGQVETVMYQFLPSMLLNEVQKQQRTIEYQAAQMQRVVAELRVKDAEIAGLKSAVAKIAELERQTAHLARLLDQQRVGAVTAGLELK